MSNLKKAPKTLFDIINEILIKYNDSNLKSDIARLKIADEICVEYYSDIYDKDTVYDTDVNYPIV